jgi:ABC-2 type transport system permease protein
VSIATYTRYELLRTFRNRRFLIFSLGFPLVIYYLIAAPNRNESNLGGTGLSAPLYLMVGLAAFGTMNAMLSSGARIAAERAVGWNRQLRITPLTTRNYFRAKVLTGYAMALSSLLLLYAAGATLGVTMSASLWVKMTALILVGLIPFAALGILIGHAVNVDSIGPVVGGLTALLSIFGGAWFPISSSGALHDIAQLLPSYWLVQASHIAVGGSAWGAEGWLVMGAWTAVLAVLAGRAYRRDTQRA